METFTFTASAIAGLVFAEAFKEIGKNIGKAIYDFVGFAAYVVVTKVTSFIRKAEGMRYQYA
ncbi:MAG: hypothetical protein EAZ76_17500 [Nostocales cyanobacterium]|nr:MAG: hypothetical protein EAZ87_15670 [Nostocales cyanobacterium]TAF07820.1 MAG: hypothetical protein EAZ76_17500 [Nostocales cyanobacterium]